MLQDYLTVETVPIHKSHMARGHMRRLPSSLYRHAHDGAMLLPEERPKQLACLLRRLTAAGASSSAV